MVHGRYHYIYVPKYRVVLYVLYIMNEQGNKKFSFLFYNHTMCFKNHQILLFYGAR